MADSCDLVLHNGPQPMPGNLKGPRKIGLFTSALSYGPICVSTFLAKKHVWWILKLITAGVVAKAPVSLQEAGWKPPKSTNRTSKSRKRRERRARAKALQREKIRIVGRGVVPWSCRVAFSSEQGPYRVTKDNVSVYQARVEENAAIAILAKDDLVWVEEIHWSLEAGRWARLSAGGPLEEEGWIAFYRASDNGQVIEKCDCQEVAAIMGPAVRRMCRWKKGK